MGEEEAIRRELARQELARRSLAAFAWYTFRGYRAAAVHRLIASELEAVERFVASGGVEGTGRLMIFCPPRHGKSELVSVRFPAWFLGRNPDCRVVLASCTADLAVGFSRQGRNIIADEAFQTLFGRLGTQSSEERVGISEDRRAADAWEIEGRRGGLAAVGVGGSIIGRGAHVAILDDPFKNRNEAESKRVRDEVDSWYRSTFYTRLEPGGAVVIMHQRWHSDDLAGRLLRRMVEEPGADRWRVVSLPAVAEGMPTDSGNGLQMQALRDGRWLGADPLGRKPGEALWSGKYGVEALERIKANLGSYEWEALYQQRPQRLEGALIRARDIIQIREDEVPREGVAWVRFWDLAVSERKRADYIVGARVGMTADGKIYIYHLRRLRGPWVDARPKMVEQMLADPAEVVQGVEVAGQQAGYYQELQRDPRLRGRSIVRVNPKEVGSKEVRAQVWATRIQDDQVHLVVGNGWDVEAFISEAVAFPRGTYDDQVDGVSGAMQMLGSGSGWALWARRQVEAMRDAGVKVREVPRPWLEVSRSNRQVEEDFVNMVQMLAAGQGDLVVIPGGLDRQAAGNLMAEIAGKYIDQGQDIKAQIVLMERKRLGV